MVKKPENLDNEWDEEFESLVDELMEERDHNGPTPLLSEKQKRDMIREELKEMLKFEKEAQAVSKAIRLIGEFGPSLLKFTKRVKE